MSKRSVTARIPSHLLDAVEAAAAQESRTRTAQIVHLLRIGLGSIQAGDRPRCEPCKGSGLGPRDGWCVECGGSGVVP